MRGDTKVIGRSRAKARRDLAITDRILSSLSDAGLFALVTTN